MIFRGIALYCLCHGDVGSAQGWLILSLVLGAGVSVTSFLRAKS